MKIEIRPTEDADRAHLFSWFQEPGILKWFPMSTEREIEDAIRIIWLNKAQGASLTAVVDEAPCGIANLYLQSFEKIAHQTLFALIVKKEVRGKGIGTALMQELIALAKKKGIELLHLEVYEKNPAISLYERLGFTKYGYEKHFIKEEGNYYGKIMMQKELI